MSTAAPRGEPVVAGAIHIHGEGERCNPRCITPDRYTDQGSFAADSGGGRRPGGRDGDDPTTVAVHRSERTAPVAQRGDFDSPRRGEKPLPPAVVRAIAGVSLLLMLFVPASIAVAVWAGDWRWIVTGAVSGLIGLFIGWLLTQGGRR